MKNNGNQSQRIYDKATRTWYEVPEDQYREFDRWRTNLRKREQYWGRCFCPRGKWWLCDGDCVDCEFHTRNEVSLDDPLPSGLVKVKTGTNTIDAVYDAWYDKVYEPSATVAYELRGTSVSVTCVCPGPTSTGFAKAANMSGVNFFTLTKPATARQLAAYAYRMMMRGRTLAYHGYLTKAGAVAERLLPHAFTRRVAARMNGGDPRRHHRA